MLSSCKVSRLPGTTTARKQVDPVSDTVDAVREHGEAIARDPKYAGEDARKDAWREAVDSEYWVCLCFASRAEKEAFLRGAGLDDLPDKIIDGAEVARRVNIELPPRPAKPLGASRRKGGRMLQFSR